MKTLFQIMGVIISTDKNHSSSSLRNGMLLLVPLLLLAFILCNLPAGIALAASNPSPSITLVNYEEEIPLGYYTIIRVYARNDGDEASWQTISVSFPQNPSDVSIVHHTLDLAEIHWPGSPLNSGYGAGTVTAIYPLAEGVSAPWPNAVVEYLDVVVKPESVGDFVFYVKTAAGRQPDGQCVAWDPASGTKDQQDEYVYRYTIRVVGDPDLYVSNTQVDGTSVPGEYRVGDKVKVACEVWNGGLGDAGSSRLGYYIGTSETDTSNRWEDDYVGALGVEEKSNEYEYYTFQQSDVGTRYFVFKADYQNEVDEGDNEGNNKAHFGPFDVTSVEGPTADFSADVTSCCDPLNVYFTDLSTAGSNPITSWYWQFGDGYTSTQQNPSHTYDAGSWSVSLTVTDSYSYSDSETKGNYITSNKGPTTDFFADPASGDAPLEVDFSDNSVPGDNPIVSWYWEFGNGDTSTAQNPSYTYNSADTYPVTLTVTDSHGCSDDATTSISVGAVYSITLNPTYGFYGEMIEVTAVVAASGTYHIYWDSRLEENRLGTFTATEFGTHTLSFYVPEYENGVHWVCLADNNLNLKATAEFEVRDFNEGDILVGRGALIVPGFWSHVGMYIGDGNIIHSHERDGADGQSGVDIVDLEWWNETYEPWAVYRVLTASSETITSAIEWATAPERLDDPYDWRWIWKSNAGQEWYCSELVWAAYWNATGGTLDIEDGPDNVGITPDEIANDDDTQEVFTTRIIGNPPDGLMLQALCPVDLAIVNPDGLSVNKEICEIDGAVYGEDDLEGDVQDWIGIPGTKTGDYSILVIPEPGASPQDTYSLVISAGNESIMLADSAQIGDIPDQGYIVRSTEEGIEQIIPPECFIATSAYGTPMADEVQILRDFRDGYLLTNPLGQAFVDFYYRTSPSIARFITEHPGLKPIVRAGLVPAVVMSAIAVNTSVTEKAVTLSVLVLVSVVVAVWVVRRRNRGSQHA